MCAGHHKVLHDGALTVTGRAPDELVFMRNGELLVDAQSRAVEELRQASTPSRSRFADVVKLEQAKRALRDLGFKAQAARDGLDIACARVGADADVGVLVKAVLDASRVQREDIVDASAGAADLVKVATQALVQLGYKRPQSAAAVERASAHVGTQDLTSLIKEALQCVGS
jgi:Holliday junction resolvasome RuvABC DNA-binding subunit